MLTLKEVAFIKSATRIDQWPSPLLPEICILGRSNVGKSSFINFLLKRKKIAKTARTPGKTRLLNFFNVNTSYCSIVDAPGYGYARVSGEIAKSFEAIMKSYLEKRLTLKLCVVLVDMRHPPTNKDKAIVEYLKTIKRSFIVIGTKLDKLRKNDIQKNIKVIKSQLKIHNSVIFIKSSAVLKINWELIWDVIDSYITI